MNAFLPVVHPGIRHGARPERRDNHQEHHIERRLQALWARLRQPHWQKFRPLLERIHAAEVELDTVSDATVRRRLMLAETLSLQSFSEETLVNLFADLRLAVADTVGLELHDEQLFAAWSMLHQNFVQMQTGEGKSVTACLPAIVAALHGVPVHVVTVNDYLVRRDCERFAPLYESFGLRVAAVCSDMDDQTRRLGYAADVVYCSAKQLAFDYLRDARARHGKPGSLSEHLGSLLAEYHEAPLLRGLCYAIIDEADSVLIDDAGTPLILAQSRNAERQDLTEATVAMSIARTMHEGIDFQFQRDASHIWMTENGLDAVRKFASRLDGVWRFERYRNERVRQALMALHAYRLDRDYLVRDGRVQLIDESTGRTLPDRRLQHGLHRMLEIKERCDLSADNEVIASISFQNFFNRYHALAGMSGTLQDVQGELGGLFGRAVLTVPTHKVCLRERLDDRLFITRDEQLQAAIELIEQCHHRGQPVLVGTRSVELSEKVAGLLSEREVEHTLLNARQDREEAAVVARAGRPGAVTVATNMAGRGTDIPLTPHSASLGGLRVLNLELNESIRVDRQLFGRAARQGDPGSASHLLCLGDEVLQKHVPRVVLDFLTWGLQRKPELAEKIAFRVIRLTQWRIEQLRASQRAAMQRSRQQIQRQWL